MYKKVTFINARGESVELFRQPLFLTRIEGLGDIDASIETQKSPNQDGSTHVYTTMNERPITMEIEILQDLREWRYDLSRIFNPKLGPGTLIYDNGYVTKSITAQSEHVPTYPDVRPKKTQTALIDLICHDPYFRDAEDTRTDVAFWEPKFQFPLDIPIIGNPNLQIYGNDFSKLLAYQGATMTITGNQIVPEWGDSAVDATRIVTTGGTSTLKAYNVIQNTPLATGRPYVTSVWAKNMGTASVHLRNNSDNITDTEFNTIAPGESKRIYHSGKSLGNVNPQFRFETDNYGDSVDIIVWCRKAEIGSIPTPWLPHVSDSNYAEYDAQQGIEMGSRTLSTIVDIVNDGHVDTGMRIRFEANGSVVNPYLTNVNTGETIKIKRTMVSGEVVEINTNLGQKRITSTRGGVTTNIFNNIVIGSKFLQLEIGDNVFRFGADSNEALLDVQIYHTNKYVGV